MRWLAMCVTAAGLCLACSNTVVDFSTSSGSGGNSASGPTTGATTTGTTTTAGPGGSTGAGGQTGEWQTLIDGDWTIAAGTEAYVCVIATVNQDMYVSAFRPISPLGTHHTVLTRANGGSDGTFPCDAFTNGENMVYGSGVGTEPLTLPDGVAVKLEQGEQLLLNLHLFNTSGSTIDGISGTEVQLIDEADVIEESRIVLAGPQDLYIPPQATSTAQGSCSISKAVTIWAVAPHMHQLGTHMTITAMKDGSPNVLHDLDYDFDGQLAHVLDGAMTLSAGDRVDVACTYNNTTNQAVTWGDSSNAEMCFGALFFYPPDAIPTFTCDF